MKPEPHWSAKIRDFLQKYRWPALILLAGIALMLLTPDRKAEAPAPTEAPGTAAEEKPDYRAETERRLARILSRIEGAGQVEVMLTLRTGPVSRYQTDVESRSESSGDRSGTEHSEKTVLFSRGSAYNEPAVAQTEYPRFRGALIVASGAGDPAVRYNLIQAVSSLLELGADRITVVPMDQYISGN